jgi:hypothetical protein
MKEIVRKATPCYRKQYSSNIKKTTKQEKDSISDYDIHDDKNISIPSEMGTIIMEMWRRERAGRTGY